MNSKINPINNSNTKKRIATYSICGTAGLAAGYLHTQLYRKKMPLPLLLLKNDNPKLNNSKNIKYHSHKLIEDITLTPQEIEQGKKELTEAKKFLKKLKIQRIGKSLIGLLVGLLAGYIIDRVFVKQSHHYQKETSNITKIN